MLPGFGPAMGFTLVYLSLMVLIPLTALVARPWEHGLAGVWHTATEPRVLAALRLSFGAAFAAAAKKYAASFPKIPLFNIDNTFGGWRTAQAKHFADGGVFDSIYTPHA